MAGGKNCRSLGFARDDKGKGDGSIESGCWTEAFVPPLRFASVGMTIHLRAGALVAGGKNCRSLGYPGFPVESCGFGQLHVVLFTENHIRGAGESCEVGNPGTLGMTKERATAP